MRKVCNGDLNVCIKLNKMELWSLHLRGKKITKDKRESLMEFRCYCFQKPLKYNIYIYIYIYIVGGIFEPSPNRIGQRLNNWESYRLGTFPNTTRHIPPNGHHVSRGRQVPSLTPHDTFRFNGHHVSKGHQVPTLIPHNTFRFDSYHVSRARLIPKSRQVPSLTPCYTFHFDGCHVSRCRRVSKGR